MNKGESHYNHTFSLTGQDEIDYITACSKFKGINILRLGIKEALKSCPKPPKKLLDEAKKLIQP